MKERKNNLITIRMDDEDKETLDYLSSHMDRTRSDTILRACKFFSNTDVNHTEDVGVSDRSRKNHYVHMRVTDSDMDFLNNNRRDANETMSTYVRKAMKAYYNSMKGVY